MSTLSALKCVKVYQSVLVLLERLIVIKRERPGQKDKWAIHTKEEHLIAKKADVEHKYKNKCCLMLTQTETNDITSNVLD